MVRLVGPKRQRPWKLVGMLALTAAALLVRAAWEQGQSAPSNPQGLWRRVTRAVGDAAGERLPWDPREALQDAEGRAGRAQAESACGAAGAAVSTPGLAGRIPKRLHQIFIPDGKPENAGLAMWPHHERWVENCKLHYSRAAGWEYRLWDAASSEELIADHYPTFLDFYRHNISLANEKSDMMRYIVLHKFGGLYLDSDVDCWRESGDMLEGYDVVLQGTHGAEGTGSAAIASVAGAAVWLKALELVRDRKTTYNNWWKSIQRTGPDLLADSLVSVGLKREEGMFKEEYQLGGLVYHVYPAGSWFLPCQWWEGSCRRTVYDQLARGKQDLKRVVGMHRFAGSWIPGKEDGSGIVNVTDEICFPKPDVLRRTRR